MLLKKLLLKYLHRVKPLTPEEAEVVTSALDNLIFNAYSLRLDSGVSYFCYQTSKHLLNYLIKGKAIGVDLKLTIEDTPQGYTKYLQGKQMPAALTEKEEARKREEARIKAILDRNLEAENERMKKLGIYADDDAQVDPMEGSAEEDV